VLGTFLVNSIPTRVLFDSGASHSFVTEHFVKKWKLESTMMTRAMLVQIPGSILKTKDNCVDVPVDIHGVHLKGICPRGNNKVVIILFRVHNRCLFFMLELY
jgi:hypothetical protein